MSRVPTVAIVGRPNVGKSSLMNRLAGRKISIVENSPGVTRDRVETEVALPAEMVGEPDLPLRVIDTGGWGIVDRDDLSAVVERQIMTGCAEADVILFVVDGQQGVVPLDRQFAQVLRETGVGSDGGKPVMLVVNKVDGDGLAHLVHDAWELGFGEPIPVSAETKFNWRTFTNVLHNSIDWDDLGELSTTDPGIRVAFVGKRNAGKSTILNALVGDERVIVSEKEGTTRDSIDVRAVLPLGGKQQIFTMIDTAGVRKTKALQGRDIEFYSQHRSLRSVRRADVCVLMIDATVKISQVDHQLVGEINKHHRPAVIVINKWDLVEHNKTQDEYVAYLESALRGLNYAPIVFASAKKQEGLREILALVDNLYQQSHHRCTTSEINDAVQALLSDNPPRTRTGKRARVYYVTQIAIDPPTLVCFVNNPEFFDNNYQRYLDNHLREILPYSEVPLRLFFNGKDKLSPEERLGMADN